MKDTEKENILKEIRSIIGDDIYNEMKGARKMKEKKRKSRTKRKKKVDGGDEEDKRNEGDVGETCKNKKGLEEEKREVSAESTCHVKNRKRIYNEETEKGDDHYENTELQDKDNVKEKHKKHKGMEFWGQMCTEDVCKYYFLKGRCKHGKKCMYSHDITPLYKMLKLCKFQLKGSCKKSHCPFSHNTNMFYCRNDLIGGSCKNPSCAFKHVPLELKFKDQKSRDSEVDQVLSKADKNLFVFNNKTFVMNILIRNYFTFNSLEDVNLNKINKNENYPWYINCAIDLLKLDLQQNRINYFYELVKNYIKEKAQNILNYVDDEKLKLQVEQEMLPKSTVEDMLKNSQQKNTQQTETKCKTINVGSEHLEKEHLKNGHIKNEHVKNEHIKNEHIKSKDIKSPNKETDSSIYEYKVFSSDEDEDYSKYLNTYLEIST